jgi:hypothetical protein
MTRLAKREDAPLRSLHRTKYAAAYAIEFDASREDGSGR